MPLICHLLGNSSQALFFCQQMILAFEAFMQLGLSKCLQATVSKFKQKRLHQSSFLIVLGHLNSNHNFFHSLHVYVNQTIIDAWNWLQHGVGNTRRSSCYHTWTLCKRDQTSQPESAMFCAHLSHFGYAVQLLPGRDFPTGHVMKKCPNHCLFSLFWRLSVDINGISSI